MKFMFFVGFFQLQLFFGVATRHFRSIDGNFVFAALRHHFKLYIYQYIMLSEYFDYISVIIYSCAVQTVGHVLTCLSIHLHVHVVAIFENRISHAVIQAMEPA